MKRAPIVDSWQFMRYLGIHCNGHQPGGGVLENGHYQTDMGLLSVGREGKDRMTSSGRSRTPGLNILPLSCHSTSRNRGALTFTKCASGCASPSPWSPLAVS